MQVKFSLCSHMFVHTNWDVILLLIGQKWATSTWWKWISSPCNSCSPANHHSWWCCRTKEFFLYQLWCSSLLAFSDWRDLACDKDFLEQDTMKSLLIRWLSLAPFSNLCTNFESPTWTSGPRKTAQCLLRHAVEVYRAILKICNFIIFQNYRGKVEIITKALKNSKG